MFSLPDVVVLMRSPLAMVFTNSTWRLAESLMAGALLTTGRRALAAALRVMGRSD